MNPPADPWNEPQPPAHPSPVPMYGRAAVPVPPAPHPEPTADLPTVPPWGGRDAGAPRRGVSWQRTSRASLRSLADGWGFTATGLIVAFSGWGVWAAALRGSGTSAWSGLVFMLVVAAGLFGLARFFGYLVVGRVLGRPRIHARWAHLLTGLFLAASGVSYLVNTTWLADAGDWLGDITGWFGEVVDWVGSLWSGA